MHTKIRILIWIISIGISVQSISQNPTIKIGTFRVDATPPIGSPVLNWYTQSIQDSLSARGVVILSDEKPIVLCAVDWVGIANKGMEMWRKRLAKAAGTDVERVSVHVVHQHDAPRCDFTTELILDEYGLGGTRFDTAFLYRTIENAAEALSEAKRNAKIVSHVGFGEAIVEKVASNRRILGEDGKVKIWRGSKSTDPGAKNAPEGPIDPWLKSVTFWQSNQPLAVLTFYATHPMSYYGKGNVSADFMGLARSSREISLNGVPHIHFTGAGGNVAAGKYNDGSPEMRPILTQRVESSMKEAFERSKENRIETPKIKWSSELIHLPLRDWLDEEELKEELKSNSISDLDKYYKARYLAWIYRMKSNKYLSVSALHLGDISLLLLPGELFIEYQLKAQEMFPKQKICTAAYRELGMFYIGTEIAYSQGGYETSEGKSLISPKSESIILNGIKKVLE